MSSGDLKVLGGARFRRVVACDVEVEEDDGAEMRSRLLPINVAS